MQVRRKPGKKQVGAAGKFNSRAPQACLGAAAAAPNPGIPILRRKREAKWPDSEKLLGNFWPLSRNDFLKLRRKPGKKQVGAAGKFNSGVPQACLGAAAAAPNPGIPILRRKREAKWPDSEKLLGNFWPLSRNDFLKLRRQPGKKQVGADGKFNSRVPQACLSAASAAPNPGMPYLRRKRVQFQGATGLPRRRISGPKLAVYLLHADSA